MMMDIHTYNHVLILFYHQILFGIHFHFSWYGHLEDQN